MLFYHHLCFFDQPRKVLCIFLKSGKKRLFSIKLEFMPKNTNRNIVAIFYCIDLRNYKYLTNFAGPFQEASNWLSYYFILLIFVPKIDIMGKNITKTRML